MPRRLRLDAELVRRGLARSREHAAELIARRAGHRGRRRRHQAGDRRDAPSRRGGGRRPATPGLRVARRPQAGRRPGVVRAAAASSVDGAPRARRGRLDRRLHRRAAAARARARSSRSTSATASWPGRCAGRRGSRCSTGPTSATSTADAARRAVDLVVGDLSFISLTKVLPALVGVVDPDGDLVLMVKPQFEVGKERLGKGGVVRDPELRVEAVLDRGARPRRARARCARACAPARCPARPATSSTSSGSGAEPRPTSTTDAVRAVVVEGPQ